MQLVNRATIKIRQLHSSKDNIRMGLIQLITASKTLPKSFHVLTSNLIQIFQNVKLANPKLILLSQHGDNPQHNRILRLLHKTKPLNSLFKTIFKNAWRFLLLGLKLIIRRWECLWRLNLIVRRSGRLKAIIWK